MRYCTRGPGLVGSVLLVSDFPGLLEWYQSVVWCSAGIIQSSCPHSISLRCDLGEIYCYYGAEALSVRFICGAN